jgi:hypothetical protein
MLSQVFDLPASDQGGSLQGAEKGEKGVVMLIHGFPVLTEKERRAIVNKVNKVNRYN